MSDGDGWGLEEPGVSGVGSVCGLVGRKERVIYGKKKGSWKSN